MSAMCAMCNINAMCAICTLKVLKRSPSAPLGSQGGSRGSSLEADCTLGEVFLSRETNAGNPRLGFWVEALEEAEGMLLLN